MELFVRRLQLLDQRPDVARAFELGYVYNYEGSFQLEDDNDAIATNTRRSDGSSDMRLRSASVRARHSSSDVLISSRPSLMRTRSKRSSTAWTTPGQRLSSGRSNVGNMWAHAVLSPPRCLQAFGNGCGSRLRHGDAMR